MASDLWYLIPVEHKSLHQAAKPRRRLKPLAAKHSLTISSPPVPFIRYASSFLGEDLYSHVGVSRFLLHLYAFDVLLRLAQRQA